MMTNAAEILAGYLRNSADSPKRVRVGNDRTYRAVADVKAKGTRGQVIYTDGETRFITMGTRIDILDDGGGGLPPSRNS